MTTILEMEKVLVGDKKASRPRKSGTSWRNNDPELDLKFRKLNPKLQIKSNKVVGIEVRIDGKKVIFKLRLRQSDVGKVIGKHGMTIIAIRNMLNAAAVRHGQRAAFDIVEDAPASA